ncbi:MAG TPA: cell division FtsA domain-containing protein, partial [Dehalococcoidales bacterium]|nr:cell division FtsA domain-containing protein [Dehalococcoidales bacterium]
KKKYGNLMVTEEEETDKIVGENGHSVSYRDLCEIMRARIEEMMRLVVLELPRTDYAKLIPAGIVITGGGANIPGIVELTQGITRLPTRIGIPPALNGVSNQLLNDPAYATSVGLILWKMKNDSSQKWVTKPSGIRGFFSSIFKLFR